MTEFPEKNRKGIA